jgi:hypothetical protein
MVRLAILYGLFLAPAAAQLREVTIELEPTDCATCTQSLPDRMTRVRGVARAEMRDSPPRVVVELDPENRVRLSRLLDVVRQDGTKVSGIALAARGEVFDAGGWKLRILPGDAPLEWVGAAPASAGKWDVRGRLAAPFRAIEVEKAEPGS